MKLTHSPNAREAPAFMPGSRAPIIIIDNASGTISIYLGNPLELGNEAQWIATINPFWLPSLIQKLTEKLNSINVVNTHGEGTMKSPFAETTVDHPPNVVNAALDAGIDI